MKKHIIFLMILAFIAAVITIIFVVSCNRHQNVIRDNATEHKGNDLEDVEHSIRNEAINNVTKIYIDGKLLPTSENPDHPLEPFTANSSTYLWIQALAEASGKEVEWDSLNQSIYIGTKPFDLNVSKIAIITNKAEDNMESYYSVQEVLGKYGSDKILHYLWPDAYYMSQFPDEIEKLLIQIASEPSIKALIINPDARGTVEALDKLLEIRDDMFIVLINPGNFELDIAPKANLVLKQDDVAMGIPMARQAKKMGAQVFVHYSSPDHMYSDLACDRRELIKKECADLGMLFVDITAPHQWNDNSATGYQNFMRENFPLMVEKYGKDTAFFCNNCEMQTSLIESVIESGAIYSQPCHPSPFHGFPMALGIIEREDSSKKGNWYEYSSDYGYSNYTDSLFRNALYAEGSIKLNDVIAKIIKDKGMSGRVSNWPILFSTLATQAAVDYAFMWINGKVSRDEIDIEVFQQCLSENAGVDCYTNPYVFDNRHYVEGMYENITLDNFLLIREDYITY